MDAEKYGFVVIEIKENRHGYCNVREMDAGTDSIRDKT